jgi:hypothetical protein
VCWAAKSHRKPCEINSTAHTNAVLPLRAMAENGKTATWCTVLLRCKRCDRATQHTLLLSCHCQP